MGPFPRRRGPALLAALLVALATLFVFARCIGFDFVDWDDPRNVYENPYYVPQVTAASLAALWRTPYNELYTPVTSSLWALCALLGHAALPPARPHGETLPFSPAPFHALNVVLHTANALLVFALLWRLSALFERSPEEGNSDSPSVVRRALAGAAGALLFSLHPLQAESVAWVTGGNNVISAFFGLLALNAYLAFARRSSPAGDGVSRGRTAGIAWFALATVFYILALLSKPTATALPLVALVLETVILRRPWRQWAPGLLLWAAGAGVIALITRTTSVLSRGVTLPLWERPFIVGDALAFYLGKLIWPAAFGIDQGHSPEVVMGAWWGYATWLVPVALAALLWWKRLRWVGAGGLLFIAAALPMLGVVPFYGMRVGTVADRYVYLAMIGPALALTWLVWRMLGETRRPGLRNGALGVISVVLILLGVRTVVVAGYWRDTMTLMTQTLATNPRSYYAWNNLGALYNRRGETDRAEQAFTKALESNPALPGTQYNLGSLLAWRGDLDGAEKHVREALRLQPAYPEAHNNLGNILRARGRTAEAIAEFREALRQAPNYAPARANLEEAERALATAAPPAPPAGGKGNPAEAANKQGLAKARAGDLTGALTEFDTAVRLRPGYAEAHFNRALTLDRLNRAAEAEAAYEAAIKVRPDYPEARMNLGTMLARQARWKEAEPQLAEAVRLRPGWPAAEQALTLVRQQITGGGTQQ